ncbi:trehalose-phosphatase [Porifericola rhodea]|uniref:trehalose-phosphatase n=1 Tax=Porifericola rhodea TaxID=930972 RepID=UPI002665FD78|nr:trehalose-phosphatase [Porifericola rhodea]WKN31077.1 trehalose-phosphatase [Porifericola rhodea]
MDLKEPHELPSALAHVQEILNKKGDKPFVFFFDFDGTLAPIVSKPDQASLSEETRTLLQKLSKEYKVAIVSGRDRKDIEERVNLHNLYYAGSHGFDIAGPNEMHHLHPEADDIIPRLEEVSEVFQELFQQEDHIKVEKKKFAVALHHRGASPELANKLEAAVKDQLEGESKLKWDKGKCIIEIKPNLEWHKGKAVLWLIEQLGYTTKDSLAIYLGDDTTDEDAFKELQKEGVGIMVEDHEQKTHAHYGLSEQKQVNEFIKQIMSYD